MDRDLSNLTRELKLRLGIGRDFRIHRTDGGALVVPKKLSEEEWIKKYTPQKDNDVSN
jgi:hypothetical protein